MHGYLDLDPRRLAYWERWTLEQCEGQVVRVYRDHARERRDVQRERETRLEQMIWRSQAWRQA
jgi:hypothetical protein